MPNRRAINHPVLLRSALLLGLVVLIGGCSLMRTAYNNLDWYLANRADEFLDLNDTQGEWLREQVRAWQRDHGPATLREYAAALDEAIVEISDGLSREEASRLLRDSEAMLMRTLAGMTPVLAELLHGLEPRQIEHLAEQLEAHNEEFRDSHIDDDQDLRFDGRADRTVNRVETWTGSLRRAQRELVRRHARTWPDHIQAWLDYRVIRQQALLQLLRDGADEAAIEAFLNAWMVERSDMPDGLGESRRQLRAGVVDMLLELDPTLEADQREDILDRLRKYRGWIDELLQQCRETRSC